MMLLDEMEEQSCKVVEYAFNPKIFLKGQSQDTLIQITQRILSVVETWCTMTGLPVKQKETEVIVFRRRYK